MNPSRVDFLTDIAYGGLIFLSVVLIVSAGTAVGVAFGFGVLVSYVIHVGWKMGRFDPEWMGEEVTESIEETLTDEVSENVSEKVTEEMTEGVEQRVAQEVTEEVTQNVEETLSEEIDTIIDKLEAVNERVDRRPRANEVEGQIGESSGGDGQGRDGRTESRGTQ